LKRPGRRRCKIRVIGSQPPATRRDHGLRRDGGRVGAGCPGLQAGRARQQDQDHAGQRRQLAERDATGTGNHPGVNGESQGCPFDWELREVGQQSPLPAAELEPHGDGARSRQGGDDDVAGMATEAALREAEGDEQERSREHARVVLKNPGRLVHAAGESGVWTRRPGQRRVEKSESDPERGHADDRARAEAGTGCLLGWGQLCGDHALTTNPLGVCSTWALVTWSVGGSPA